MSKILIGLRLSSVSRFGRAYQVWLDLPYHCNKDGVFADGEQRAEVLREHGEFFAPVLRLSVSDVDRRMLRQILNKLKGTHNKELDAAEFKRIAELGQKEDLKLLLVSVGERLPDDFEWQKRFCDGS